MKIRKNKKSKTVVQNIEANSSSDLSKQRVKQLSDYDEELTTLTLTYRDAIVSIHDSARDSKCYIERSVAVKNLNKAKSVYEKAKALLKLAHNIKEG